jgi:hypothetical protein
LEPALDSGDDAARFGGPDEGLGIIVGLGDEAMDGGLEVVDGTKDAALEPALTELAKKVSTALSQEQDLGVKWKVQRGCRASQASTTGCLWVA